MEVKRTKVLDHGYVDLIQSMPPHPLDVRANLDWGPGDRAIVNSARGMAPGESTDSIDEERKLLTNLWRSRRLRPFESVQLQVRMHIPVFVARQLAHLRFQSTNEASDSKIPNVFYVPQPDQMLSQCKRGTVCNAEDRRRSMVQHNRECYDLYDGLLASGLSYESARLVLPVSVYTILHYSMSFFDWTDAVTAQSMAEDRYELSQYLDAIRDMFRGIAPCAVKNFECHPLKTDKDRSVE